MAKLHGGYEAWWYFRGTRRVPAYQCTARSSSSMLPIHVDRRLSRRYALHENPERKDAKSKSSLDRLGRHPNQEHSFRNHNMVLTTRIWFWCLKTIFWLFKTIIRVSFPGHGLRYCRQPNPQLRRCGCKEGQVMSRKGITYAKPF